MKRIFGIIAIVIATCAGSVYGTTAEITLFDGTNTITIQDNGPGDLNPAVGVMQTLNLFLGNWAIVITEGFTKPDLGSATQPHMDLGFQVQSVGAGTLQITFSDTGFSFGGGAHDAIGGTTVGTVNDFIDVNGSHVLHLGSFGPGEFSGHTNGNLTLAPSDTLALVVDITHSGAGLTTGDKELTTTVPDGGSAVALLGIALVGIEILRRRKMALT